MAGSPNRRAQRAVTDATRALMEGREDDARRALAELKRTLDETGVETPVLPPDVMSLWVSISEAKPGRLAKVDGTALMTDAARQRLLQAGEIATQRLLEMLGDDRMFGYYGILTYDQQMGWLNLAMQRGFGGMPAGAQRVPLPEQAPGQMAIGSTLQMLVRARQEQHEVIEGEAINGYGDEMAADEGDGYGDEMAAARRGRADEGDGGHPRTSRAPRRVRAGASSASPASPDDVPS